MTVPRPPILDSFFREADVPIESQISVWFPKAETLTQFNEWRRIAIKHFGKARINDQGSLLTAVWDCGQFKIHLSVDTREIDAHISLSTPTRTQFIEQGDTP